MNEKNITSVPIAYVGHGRTLLNNALLETVRKSALVVRPDSGEPCNIDEQRGIMKDIIPSELPLLIENTYRTPINVYYQKSKKPYWHKGKLKYK